jgi:hypothetical protein
MTKEPLSIDQLEQIAAEVRHEINETRVRLNRLHAEHPSSGVAGSFDSVVIEALGRVHGSQMAAERTLRREIERRARNADDDAIAALLGSIACRPPTVEED